MIKENHLKLKIHRNTVLISYKPVMVAGRVQKHSNSSLR